VLLYSSLVLWFPFPASPVTAPPHRRGPGPRPVASFEYNLRRDIPTNLLVRSGCDRPQRGHLLPGSLILANRDMFLTHHGKLFNF
jgi:hypothetical protein